MRSSFKGGSAVASLSHRRANTALPGDALYMGINIPEVERQKASKALNCDRQCPLWVKKQTNGLGPQSSFVRFGPITDKCGRNWIVPFVPKRTLPATTQRGERVALRRVMPRRDPFLPS
jgi:hypothetical protein